MWQKLISASCDIQTYRTGHRIGKQVALSWLVCPIFKRSGDLEHQRQDTKPLDPAISNHVMHSPFGFVHLTHQNLSARTLVCRNALAKVNTQLLIYNYTFIFYQGIHIFKTQIYNSWVIWSVFNLGKKLHVFCESVHLHQKIYMYMHTNNLAYTTTTNIVILQSSSPSCIFPTNFLNIFSLGKLIMISTSLYFLFWQSLTFLTALKTKCAVS